MFACYSLTREKGLCGHIMLYLTLKFGLASLLEMKTRLFVKDTLHHEGHSTMIFSYVLQILPFKFFIFV